jgi:hypothetical protein
MNDIATFEYGARSTLQAQVAALVAASPAAPAVAAAAAGHTVTFAEMPQTLNPDDLLDYLSKRGASVLEQGCKPLDDKAPINGFRMTPNQTVVFVKALRRHSIHMGWLQGTLQITKFTSRTGTTVDIIDCYGQIDEASLKTQCELFCKAGEANAESRAKQNNTMMAICLSKSLTSDAQARLHTYRNEFTFNGVEYAHLMYKVIMCLATIDTITTTQTLRDNLHSLGVFAGTVHGDINNRGSTRMFPPF